MKVNDVMENKENYLRKKLDSYAYNYGTLDQRTLKISQELDKFMVEDMKKEMKRILCKGFN
ncbi:aspartyl-phosphate phosphatase Spo0E family protein [Clostridium autoethanogenum]|nr:aspartyl-phosphate phosphatase Spo0E family protein [Clostridium autoethanogenum]